MTGFDRQSWFAGMQRQGAKKMREVFEERGPEAARDAGRRFERFANGWLEHNGHAVEGQPFVLRPIALPVSH